MKTLAIFLCMICFNLITYAQDENEYRETDRIALNIPSSQTNSTNDIAAYINAHFNTDNKKVRAIYMWEISHIKYSADSMHRIILNEDREELVTLALRRKKGVCENFAAIFADICKKCGLQSFVVEGYTKQNGSVDKTPHAWCTAFVDNKWLLFDPTWDAGKAGSFYQPANTIYFEASPSFFIQTHMPFDPMFQLLDYPLTYKEFNTGNSRSHIDYFNYADSLIAYQKSDPLSAYASSLSRIKNNGPHNTMTDTKLNQLKMEIEIINQDKDSVMYNGAVADYNTAVSLFNSFLTYRNNQFKPEKTGGEVQSIFDEIEKQIASSRVKLKELNQSKAILTLDTGDVEYALNNLSAHVKEQEAFLKNYTGKATATDKE